MFRHPRLGSHELCAKAEILNRLLSRVDTVEHTSSEFPPIPLAVFRYFLSKANAQPHQLGAEASRITSYIWGRRVRRYSVGADFTRTRALISFSATSWRRFSLS
jgi:hypothetical protein